MLSEQAITTADAFWAAHLDCAPGELFSEPLRIITHGAEWADFGGAMALFRGGGAVATVPPDRADRLRVLLSPLSRGCSPDYFASALRPISSVVVGPAYIGYTEAAFPPTHPARALVPDDARALDALQQACDTTEWAHGGSDIAHPCSAVFVGGQIVALAGYKVWGGAIAHISIVTHPGFRGRSFGRSAVAHLARRAVAAGLLPQYRTLISNRTSVRLAESLGFCSYATSTTVRFERSV